ncbi:MAG: T9SS type A sorting domain-containing protein [Bacteroidales bacterium]|jgi:hypothetical protein|nr:T9SS type A sorting domain-containing protein [Bacteroidales bacterium]
MKKPIIFPTFVIKISLIIIVMFTSLHLICQNITLQGKHFYLEGEKFYPMAVNYIVENILHDDNYFLSPTHCYRTNDYECNSPQTCSTQIEEDFAYIAGMGFNTVRIMGVSPDYYPDKGLWSLVYHTADTITDTLIVNPGDPSDPAMDFILRECDNILELANSTTPPLKIIFVMTGRKTTFDDTEINLWSSYHAAFATRIRNSPHGDALLAYDLINEPGDNMKNIINNMSKQDACNIVSSWYDNIKTHDPDHLITFGNFNMEDIFVFDHSMLKVDFNSYHYYPRFRPYEDLSDPIVQEKMRVRTANHLYWINEVSIVPWIIGETSFSAKNNIEISYFGTLDDQGDYVSYTLDAVCNCGGSGFSWWQYQDVYWDSAEHKYVGLLKLGFNPGPLAEKQPAVDYFRNYIPVITGECPVDYSPVFDANKIYYNVYGHPSSPGEFSRHVADQDGNPIKDAVVTVWTKLAENVYPIYYTHTDVNGYFTAIPAPAYLPEHTMSKIVGIKVSAAGASVYYKWAPENIGIEIPDTIILTKIKDNISVTGESVSNGQTKDYKGWRSLTVSNTNINPGGNAVFTSAKNITLLPGFSADAGSLVSMYIAPYDCEEWEPLKSKSMLHVYKEDSGGFYETEKSITVEFITGETVMDNYLNIFPNPANAMVTIQLYSNNGESFIESVKLYDVSGKVFLNKQMHESSYIVDISLYPKGIYVLEVKDGIKTYYEKLIKK